jgi:hypothetical protein
MKIIVDEAGKKAIDSLCDVALKAGGANSLNFVIEVLQSTALEEVVESKESETK